MNTPPKDLLIQNRQRSLLSALVILALGLTLTALAFLSLKSTSDERIQHAFEADCNEIQLHIDARLDACTQTLYSAAALFDASLSVEREEWRAYTQGLHLEKQLPGIQGVGFACVVPPQQLAQHIKEIRNQGFPTYEIKPAGVRNRYTSIIYLEPFSDRNLRAFGYDMFTEPVRRAAMERACDTNGVALSSKVVLLQETAKDIQAGTLMYLPVYRHGMPVTTTTERWDALMGWVYSPFRMTDLMNGALKNLDLKKKQILLSIYDGDTFIALQEF